MFNTLKELRNREEGEFNLAGLIVSTALLSVFLIAVGPPTKTSSDIAVQTQKIDTSTAGFEVATDLRFIYEKANECAATYDDKEELFGTYNSGQYFTELTRKELDPCISTKISPASTLHYEVKRSGANLLCIAGYDTARDTDEYTANKPYIYAGPDQIIYKNTKLSCAAVANEEQSFNWEEMK